MRAWLAGVSVVVVGMTAPSLGLAAAPEVQRPGVASDPPVEAAPTPEEAAPTPEEAGPAPEEAGPAPEETAPVEPDSGALPGAFDEVQAPPPVEPEDASGLPSYDDSIPTYAEAPPVLELPPSRPPDGRGRLAAGSILVGGGAVLVGVSVAMIIQDTDIAAWIPGSVIGAGALIAGMSSMLGSHGRMKEYREWATDYGGVRSIPPTGTGMLASGVVCLAAGGFGVLMGSLSFTLQDDDDPPYGQVIVPLGLASVATGVGLLIGGAKRQKKFRSWEGSVTPTVGVLPGLRRQPAGVSFGVAARF